MKYQFQKTFENDSDIFPNVARIPNGTLKKVDPTNSILVEYLKHVNPSVETGILLQKSDVGSSKKVRGKGCC